MADPTKHLNFKGGSIISDLKNMFSILKTRKAVSFAYGFMFAFVAFTVFLAFNPSTANSSSPWFTNILGGTSSSNTSNASSSGSHFPSILSYFFPNTSTSINNSVPVNKDLSSMNNHTQGTVFTGEAQDLKGKNDTSVASNLPKQEGETNSGKVDKVDFEKNMSSSSNKPVEASISNEVNAKNQTLSTGNVVEASQPAKSGSSKDAGKLVNEVSNNTGSLPKKKSDNDGANTGGLVKEGIEDIVKSLVNCNLFDGHWVRDDSYPLYKPGSCSVIDDQFRCINNGRLDKDYQKMKWKPKGCTLPRMNGTHLLELIRGKRLVFVGDSLNRNMWESLICILRSSVKHHSKVYEKSGRVHFRGESSYNFVFEEYNCTVEFFVSPFLVREWETPDKNGKEKETLRLDLVGKSSGMYKDADFIIFNTGHWWTHDKTSKGKDYYQEGSHIYGELNVLEAFRKALTTWARWVDANVNPAKSMVFFRGYSAAHFSGGQWNSGGSCDHETEPIKNDTFLKPYPAKMMVLERVLRGMKTHVTYLNITRLTDFRKDGHPSMYRKVKSGLHSQDCSHWCLPGVPDAWNELFYAELLVKQYQRQQQQQKDP